MGSLVVEGPDRAAGEVRVRKMEAGRFPCSSLYAQLLHTHTHTRKDNSQGTKLAGPKSSNGGIWSLHWCISRDV